MEKPVVISINHAGHLEKLGDLKDFLLTHSGKFHADEVIAIGLLRLLEANRAKPVVRTREKSIMNAASHVVDVGGVYDPATNRFDHHMVDFTEKYDEQHAGTVLSSAGCVWKHYGEPILTEYFGCSSPQLIAFLKKWIYENFVEAIDAIDNGEPLYRAEVVPPTVEALQTALQTATGLADAGQAQALWDLIYGNGDLTKAKVYESFRSRTDISCRIGNFNTDWNDPKADENDAFAMAVVAGQKEFIEMVEKVIRCVWPVRKMVMDGLDELTNYHSSGRIMKMDDAVPFEGHLYDLEEERGIEGRVLFIIYPDWKDPSVFRVKAVGRKNESFVNRLNLPEEFGGVDEETLRRIGTPGLNFVHKGLFVGSADSEVNAKLLCERALQNLR